jgi:uncharacterized protein (TIGR02391 family)
MSDPITELRKLYGRLRGIDRAISSATGNIPGSVANDYDLVLASIQKVTGEDLTSLASHSVNHYTGGSSQVFYDHVGLSAKVQQLIGLVESGYSVGDKIIELGSLYNSIKDEELRGRCGDLLTAPSHFDRVVNQATQVLEMRIRRKASLSNTDIGADLVNKAINPEPAKSIIQISDIKSEQEGFANICRGIMQALRNETHHRAAEFTREDAFAVCGFIDRLLRIVDRASVKS